MQNYKDNCLISDGNALLDLAIICNIGDRSDQQDSFGYDLRQNDCLVSICDGMGGYEGGKLASNTAIETILKVFANNHTSKPPTEYLLEAATEANQKIINIKGDDGANLHAGSTIVSVVISGDKLHWISIGDSRIYLIRKGEMVHVTQDHNYKLVLDEKLAFGDISQDEYQASIEKGEMLVSFLGMGDLWLIDNNEEPFTLVKDDILLLMSDGLYKLLDDEEMKSIVNNFSNMADAVSAMEQMTKRRARTKGKSRDNVTIAIVRYTGGK